MRNNLRSILKKTLRSNRGVALLIVLAGIMLLTSIMVEFAFESNVSYNLSLNELDRTQAYYLAESGMSFAKFILKYNNEAKQMASKASKSAGKNYQIQPLYQMIPLDTPMIRAMGQGQEVAEEAEIPEESVNADLEGEENTDSAEEGGEESVGASSIFGLEGLQAFIDFQGDFSAIITEEDAKLNINALYNFTPKDKSYERIKSLLYHLLATSEFEGSFSDRYRGAQELAQNIADYIDRDDVYNEPDGGERGREVAGQNQGTKMKNAKLLTIEELNLIPGMTEDVFQKLKKYLTIYGKDEKIYLCTAGDPLIKAMILSYTEKNPKMEPIRDDNEELLDKVLTVIHDNCPNTEGMTQLIDQVLGVVPEDSNSDYDDEKPTTTTSKGKINKADNNTSKGGDASNYSFEDFLKADPSIFNIISTGRVGESQVNIKTILDTSTGQPQGWKQLYWKSN